MDAPLKSGPSETDVRLAVIGTSAIGALEALLVVNDVENVPSKGFALLFLLSMALRIKWRRDANAARWWWPVETVLFLWVIKDQWMYRIRTPNPIVEFAKAQAIKYVTRYPIEVVRLIPTVTRWVRWIKWFVPFFGLFNKTKGTVERWYKMHKQRQSRRQRQRFVRKLNMQLSPAESEHAAAVKLQSAFRARRARKHVERFRRKSQLLARWAASRISVHVRRHRARLAARADTRPFLFRPDSVFIHRWKLACIAVVLIEVLGLVVTAEETGKSVSHGETLGTLAQHAGLVASECVVPLSKGPRDWKTLGLTHTRVAGPLPSHCTAADHEGGLGSTVLSLLLGASPMALLISLLAVAVNFVAIADTFVEYFIGVLDPKTGVLTHKGLFARYLAPGTSLGFNLLINPAFPVANRALKALIFANNSNHFWRFLFLFQPFRKCVEEWATPILRRTMRKHAQTFSSMTTALAFGRAPTKPAAAEEPRPLHNAAAIKACASFSNLSDAHPAKAKAKARPPSRATPVTGVSERRTRPRTSPARRRR